MCGGQMHNRMYLQAAAFQQLLNCVAFKTVAKIIRQRFWTTGSLQFTYRLFYTK